MIENRKSKNSKKKQIVWINKFIKNSFLILFLLAIIFFYKIIIHYDQMIYPPGDIFVILAPYKIILTQGIETFHSLPLWNPYFFGGMPFIGDPVPAFFYPLTYLFFIFPIYSAFGYFFIIDSLLIGIFTYLFARSIEESKFGSLISAVVIMFSSNLMGLIFLGYTENLDTFIWFPLILFFTEKIIRKNNNIYFVLGGIPIALSLLAGAPEVSFYMLLSACIYFVIRLMLVREAFGINLIVKKIGYFITSIFIGAGLSAIQLLPSNELASFSARTLGIFTENEYLSPKTLISLFSPNFFGSGLDSTYWAPGNAWVNSIYIGIVPLILVIVALSRYKNKNTIIFGLIALFAIFYSFGNQSFVFPFFQHYFPFAKYFKYSSRFLYIFTFSISILSGVGAGYLVKDLKTKKNLFKILTSTSLLISIFCLILFFVLNTTGGFNFFNHHILKNVYAQNQSHFLIFSHILSDLRFLFIVLFLFSAILVIFKLKKSRSFLEMGLLFLIFIDLFLFISPNIKTKEISRATYRPAELIEIVDKDFSRTFRLDKLAVTQENITKIQSVQSFDPLFLSYYRQFVYLAGPSEKQFASMFSSLTDITNQDIIDLLNVRYVYSKKQLSASGLTLIRKTTIKDGDWKGVWYLYKNNEMLPRAYIIPNAIVADSNRSLSMLRKKEIDIRKTIILDKKPKSSLVNKTGKYTIKINKYEPNKISISTNISAPGYLVLSETWYPGWKVFVNGQQKELLKVDTIFRSVYLDSKENNVTFIYDPDSYEKGRIISILVLIFVLGYCIRYFLSRKKTLSPQEKH